MKNTDSQTSIFNFSALPSSTPNENFSTFIEHARNIAKNTGLRWNIDLNAKGVACSGHEWDLRKIANDGRPKTYVLRKFSNCEDALLKMVEKNLIQPAAATIRPVSQGWQELIKAHTLDHVLVRKKSLGYIGSSSNAWRFLATVSNKEPWEITSDDVILACEISEECQKTKNGRTVILMGLMRSFADPMHLFDACPLASLVNRRTKGRVARAKFTQIENKLPKTLSERKSEEKLPERKAFWELIRIVFTEKPLTLNDAIRFSMVKLLLITGLRVGEIALLPLDWRRTRSYLNETGKPAGESGGISESLMIRHFAEKQGTNLLYETTQFVPDMFKAEIESIFEEAIRLTEPLRATLKSQYESGRIFPQYQPEQLVDAIEMYTHLTGNPVWEAAPLSPAVTDCLAQYKETLDHKKLFNLSKLQNGTETVAAAISRYYSRINRNRGLILRDSYGNPNYGRGVRGKYLLISDVEKYVTLHVPTKLSDLNTLSLDNGAEMKPWEALFVMAKRAVGAGRGDSVLDPSKTFSVGVADESLLMTTLGDKGQKERQSLFSVYGQTEADRALSIKTHSFRHLQNTELFRLGVADTIITKRFNRRSVAQSYEYDHRSLAEEMDQLELPDEWALVLGESKAATVAKMITAGKANGPIVREFRQIQTSDGDQAALQFLSAEADGFHATPYGTCLNSFTVDPCPTHLECFNGCRHLSATNLPEHVENLVVLQGKLRLALKHAQAKPDGSVGKSNQIAHAQVRLDGVEKLLITPTGQAVFPDGIDHSAPKQFRSVLNVT